MIGVIQERWAGLKKKSIKAIAEEFSIRASTAKKYIGMTRAEIARLDSPTEYKKRKTVMDEYMNIIYKMLRDKVKPEIIMGYVIKSGYTGNWKTLEKYIYQFAKNNFDLRIGKTWAYRFEYPDDVIIIKRNELLKYITTKNPKTKKNETLSQYFEIITQRYPAVIALKEIYDCFYDTIMGDNPQNLDDFIMKFKDSAINGFVEGIIKDMVPVKNAISFDESNGFVEGNNNKFKLIKRILYGRANLDTLFKKTYIAFKANLDNFMSL